MDFSTIQNIDFQVLQWFNGSNNVILDQLALVLTSGFTWIPLYVVLFIVVMRANCRLKLISSSPGDSRRARS